MAREIAARLGSFAVELDASFHQENWTRLEEEEFRSRIAAIAAEERWVIDGNYSSHVQDLVWSAADVVVWLDLPLRVVIPAITRRTLTRMFRRTNQCWESTSLMVPSPALLTDMLLPTSFWTR